MSDLVVFLAGLATGVLGNETIRAFVRKVTKGRFFGAVPASQASKAETTKPGA